jgi:uracil-DNA glycosylase
MRRTAATLGPRLAQAAAELRVVVLYGRKAAAGWLALRVAIPVVEVPHPSPMNLNTRPDARAKVLAGLRKAQEIADAHDAG